MSEKPRIRKVSVGLHPVIGALQPAFNYMDTEEIESVVGDLIETYHRQLSIKKSIKKTWSI